MATSTDLDVPARALAVGAHPDDIEFQAGATLAKWAEAGCSLLFVICTDGSKGSWDPDEDVATLVATRQREARDAAQCIGNGDVVFLGWPDGELAATLREQWQVSYWIRRFKPDVVLGHDPWKRYRLHPDHRNAGVLVCDSIVAARDPHFFPEQNVAPHRPEALLLFEAESPDHVEDASGHVGAKLEALMRHRSQLRSTMHIDEPANHDQVAAFEARQKEKLAAHGALAGLELGEAFKLITQL